MKQKNFKKNFQKFLLAQNASWLITRGLIHTPNGLILRSESLDFLIRGYATFINNTGQSPTWARNSIVNLFGGVSEKNLNYLETEDKRCFIGYLLPGLTVNSPVVQGRIMNCSNYVSPYDSAIEEPNLKLLNSLDLVASVRTEVDNQSYDISLFALSRFAEHARTDLIGSQLRTNLKTLRKCLVILAELIRFSVPAERTNALSQILKYDGQECTYRINSPWVFVLDLDHKLITCYPKDWEELKRIYRV